ncbi:MAG: FAD-binding oxidoreductase, partial [Aldersonia sp.]|nr:FAD-binding oxidoreductase [Aldersonia sp.]
MRLAGLTTERQLPQFASRRRLHAELGRSAPDPDTVLFVDTFTAAFRPHVAGAARRVLADADRRVECRADVCCGLTWISTGQLRRARKVLAKTVDKLDDGTNRPIVVVEPSCAAALRKDMPELVHSAAARRVADRVRSFATAVTELTAAGWRPQAPVPQHVTVQTHCHEYSTFGAGTQRRALAALGVGNVTEATGCCGVAGNFGFEAEHYPLSMQVAEQALVPALRASEPDTAVLADGFSCRMQVEQLGRDSLHLAELIDPDRQEAPP